MKRFFSMNSQNEFSLHETIEEAKAAAREAFDYCKDEAYSDDGWPECVTEICYGELLGQVFEESREPCPGCHEDGAEHVDYALRDLPHNT